MKPDLKNQLLSNGLLSEEDYGKAEEHASKEGVSLQESLIELNLLEISQLGQSLAQIYGIPYKKLDGVTPSQSARNFISTKCSDQWGVFPVSYNPHINLITIAVKDDEQALKMNRIYRFLLDGQNVAFTIASEPELKSVIGSLSKEVKQKPVRSAPVKTLVPQEEKAAQKEKAETREEKKGLLQWQDKGKDEGGNLKPESKAEEPKAEAKGLGLTKAQPRAEAPVHVPSAEVAQSEALLKSLSSAVSLLVTAHLTGKPKELSSARSAASYCQLAAARLGFTPEQTVKLVISGWLSALKDNPEIIKQFTCPYDLESIIFSKGADDDPPEAVVLELINAYQRIELEHPEEAHDLHAVRRHLHILWPAAGIHEDVIETFLQILMDEQFMNKFEHETGTILLLDIDGSAAAEVERPLSRSGFKVHLAGSVSEAQAVIYESVPDFILASSSSGEDAVLKFCKQTKAETATANVPLEVLVSPVSDVRGAEYLRAGADDFLTMPVDMELLYLKIEKQMKAASARPDGNDEGVTGSLADMSFCDMLQMLNVSAKSMDITITRGEETGRVVLNQGNVTHCQLGDIVGENAFYDIMMWDDGKFAMKECVQFPEQTVTSSTMSLLMEGARLADEEQPEG